MATNGARLQVAEKARATTFDQLNLQLSNVQGAKIAVLKCVKSNLPNYIRFIFHQVKQSTEAYLCRRLPLVTKKRGDTSLLESVCQITELLDKVHGDISGWGEGQFTQ